MTSNVAAAIAMALVLALLCTAVMVESFPHLGNSNNVHHTHDTTKKRIVRWVSDGNGSQFGISEGTPVDFHTASSICHKQKSMLVVIHSAAENNFLATHPYIQPKSSYWIGAIKNYEATWRWVDNSPFYYTNWFALTNELNRHDYGHTCVAMLPVSFGNGTWSDKACRHHRQFICMRGACKANHSNCNGNHGCGINLNTDANHCGTCSNVCSSNNIASPVCSQSTCTGACNAGYLDCNGNKLVDGCEVHPSTDPQNCGGCGAVCSRNNIASPTCAASSCSGECNAGYTDCNGNKLSDGCEINLMNDVNSCGTCGNVCPTTTNGTTVCHLGSCEIVCNAGFTLCGGLCKDLQTDVDNCGTCGNSCSATGSSSVACSAGQCTGNCTSGYNLVVGNNPPCNVVACPPNSNGAPFCQCSPGYAGPLNFSTITSSYVGSCTLDVVETHGDDGSCPCRSYCRTNWGYEITNQRPSWPGASCLGAYVTAGGPAINCNSTYAGFITCQCVYATQWSGGRQFNAWIYSPACGAW